MTGISHTFLSTSYSSAPTCTVIRFFPRQNVFPVISSKIRQSNKASNEQAFSFIRLYTKTVPFPSTQKYRYPVPRSPAAQGTLLQSFAVDRNYQPFALKCTSARHGIQFEESADLQFASTPKIFGAKRCEVLAVVMLKIQEFWCVTLHGWVKQFENSLGPLYPLGQRFSNFFQVGTTFIGQNVLRTTLILGLSNSLGLP